MEKSVLLLGYGYVASFLKKRLEEKGYKVSSTSRSGAPHISFSLTDENTWDNISTVDYTIWTFPAEPIAVVEKFYRKCGDKLGELIVIGSTGSFVTTGAEDLVTEATVLDESMSRVAGENSLLKSGAKVIHASGIYGPGRNPLDWVKKGYVGKSQKFVNMIHVEDLSQFLINGILYGKPSTRYIASDNNPQRWTDVITAWEDGGLLKDVPIKESTRSSKRVDSSRSIKELKVNLKYLDFSDAVSQGLQSE